MLLPVSPEAGIDDVDERIVEADNDLKMRTAWPGVTTAARRKQKGRCSVRCIALKRRVSGLSKLSA
jgi:hypothetical protein